MQEDESEATRCNDIVMLVSSDKHCTSHDHAHALSQAVERLCVFGPMLFAINGRATAAHLRWQGICWSVYRRACNYSRCLGMLPGFMVHTWGGCSPAACS